MEKGNLLYAEFKTLVIRILKELSEDHNSIKKKKPNPVRNKGCTNWNKEQFTQGINRRVDEAKNQISDLEYKKAMNN